MDSFKKYGKPFYVIWSCISLLLVVGVVVINFCFEKPVTSLAVYFNALNVKQETPEGDIVESDVPIIQVNIAKSDTNLDLTLTEIVIGTYTDYQGNDYNQFAIQVVGEDVKYWCPKGGTFEYKQASELRYSNGSKYPVYFYQIDSNGNAQKISEDVFNEAMSHLYLPTDDNLFRLSIGNSEETYKYSVSKFNNDFTSWFLNSASFGIYDTYKTVEQKYNIYDLYYDLLQRSYTDSDSNITRQLKNVDLNRYFTLRKESNGQFYSMSDFTDEFAYFTIKSTCNYINNVLTVEDSIIGLIKGSESYSSSINDGKTNYYYNGVNVILNGYSFTPTYYAALQGYVLTLSDTFGQYLSTLNDTIFNVDINIDGFDLDYDIVGFDLRTLTMLKVNTFSLSSDINQDFYIIGTSKHIQEFEYSDTLNVLEYLTGGANGQGN